MPCRQATHSGGSEGAAGSSFANPTARVIWMSSASDSAPIFFIKVGTPQLDRPQPDVQVAGDQLVGRARPGPWPGPPVLRL